MLVGQAEQLVFEWQSEFLVKAESEVRKEVGDGLGELLTGFSAVHIVENVELVLVLVEI